MMVPSENQRTEGADGNGGGSGWVSSSGFGRLGTDRLCCGGGLVIVCEVFAGKVVPVKQSGFLKRLKSRACLESRRRGGTMERFSDILAVLGLATVFMSIAIMIACWG